MQFLKVWRCFGVVILTSLVFQPFDGTQILPKDQINLASYFDVSERDAKPIILLVSNAEFALPVLNALGVDTTRWKGKDGEDVLSQLFGLVRSSHLLNFGLDA